MKESLCPLCFKKSKKGWWIGLILLSWCQGTRCLLERNLRLKGSCQGEGKLAMLIPLWTKAVSVFNEGLNLDKTEYAIVFMITNAFQKVLKYSSYLTRVSKLEDCNLNICVSAKEQIYKIYSGGRRCKLIKWGM